MTKNTPNTPKKGVTYQLGCKERGVITVLDGGKGKRIMMLSDYVAMKKTEGEKTSPKTFLNRCAENSIKVLTSIKGQRKYNIWVCLDGEISPSLGSDNGIFFVKIANQWRALQYVECYQKQNGINSKQAVLFKSRQGIGGLSHAALNRYNSLQKLNFVVLPI